MLCELCRQYKFVTLVLALHRDEEIRLSHQPSWSSLCAAVEFGCDFCKLCWWTVVHAYRKCREDTWSEATVSEYHQRLDAEDQTHFTLSTSNLATGFFYDRSQRNPDPEGYSEDRFPNIVGGRPHLMVCSEDREPRLKSRLVASEASFSLCRSWLELCTTTHAKCGDIRDRELPTRLIDVGRGKREPRLVLTKGLKGQYVTLSHCWGDSHPPVTNSASFAAYLDQIPFQTLPRTFRDAIIIVRELGLRYLWIDCFCIVQGDKADWEIECARMHRTFENSAFTIAGPGARNPDAGILHTRPTPPADPCEMLVKDEAGSFEGHITVSITDHYVSRYGGYPIPEVGSFLDQRAWIVQERFLSSRILYFGTAQLYFECRVSELYESTFTEYQSDWNTSRLIPEISRAGFSFGKAPRADRADVEIWWRLIEIYSDRQLTKRSDKLPALSGIASRLQACIDDEYLAGLWRKSLPNDLGWVTTQSHQRAPQMSQHAAQYVAPSWSWASCNRPVHVEIGTRPSTPQIEIHKAYTVLTGLDPFGEVRYGELEVSGRLKATNVWRRPTPVAAGRVTSPGQPGDLVASSSVFSSADNDDEVVAELIPDDVMEGSEVESFRRLVWCLLLKFNQAHDEHPDFVSLTRECWIALALEPVDTHRGRVFRRVGLMQSYNLAAAHPTVLRTTGKSKLQDDRERDMRRRWFDDAAIQRITII